MIEILTAFLVIITGCYAWFTFKLQKANEDVLREMRKQQNALQRGAFSAAWSRLDELLLQNPKLTEIWLEPETLSVIKAKCLNEGALEEYFRRRAFASIIIGIYFRDWQLRQQIQEIGGYELSEITIDNEELWKMWCEGGIREDYATFPEFVDFVERYFFRNFGIPNNGTALDAAKGK